MSNNLTGCEKLSTPVLQPSPLRNNKQTIQNIMKVFKIQPTLPLPIQTTVENSKEFLLRAVSDPYKQEDEVKYNEIKSLRNYCKNPFELQSPAIEEVCEYEIDDLIIELDL